MVDEYQKVIDDMLEKVKYLKEEHKGNEECTLLIEEIKINLLRLGLSIDIQEQEKGAQ